MMVLMEEEGQRTRSSAEPLSIRQPANKIIEFLLDSLLYERNG